MIISLLPHPIILSPSIVLSIKDQCVPVVIFFAFASVLGENWKTRKNGEVLYEAIFSVKTHSFQASNFLGFPVFPPESDDNCCVGCCVGPH